MAGTSGAGARKREAAERVPQWGPDETREFIRIRAELERDFTASKRNRTLWEAVAARMRELGFWRSPEQCKCKWKNLVNRYKGKETSDPDNGRQCPFFNELHGVFAEREKDMHRLLSQSESSSLHPKKRTKRTNGDRSSDEFSEDHDEDYNISDSERPDTTRKKKIDKQRRQAQGSALDKPSRTTGSINNILQEFLQQQQRMEVQWHHTLERRTQERLLFEMEWRRSMEKLERERLMLDQAWREREEQRRIREENRAEKRDTLLTSLLNKLVNEEDL